MSELMKEARPMSEPTKESLARAQKWSDKQFYYTCKIPFLHSLALEFDAIRREERAKADALILAAYETCAKHWPIADRDGDLECMADRCDWFERIGSGSKSKEIQWAEHIRSLPPDSARRAMEVREVQIKSEVMQELNYRANNSDKSLQEICLEYSEEVEHRRTELEGDKHD